jgi:hypothetical protein
LGPTLLLLLSALLLLLLLELLLLLSLLSNVLPYPARNLRAKATTAADEGGGGTSNSNSPICAAGHAQMQQPVSRQAVEAKDKMNYGIACELCCCRMQSHTPIQVFWEGRPLLRHMPDLAAPALSGAS